MQRAIRSTLLLVAIICAIIGVPSAARAGSVQYLSKHPLPRKVGRGFCYIEVPHFHDYPPSDPRLYRQVGGRNYFVGDPTPFDYEGQRYSFYGAHPVVDASVQLGGPTYCYLRGPHYHWYAPPAQAEFELRGGAYWYVGAYEPVYYSERPRYVVVNDAYAPIVYARPVVDVTIAPPAFRGEIIAAGPSWRGAAVVGGPAVSAGLVVAAPPPPVVHVGVGVNLGGPPAVIERREVYVRERHDHGKHRGWAKHGKHDGGWRGPPPPVPRGGIWRGSPAPAPVAASGGWRGGAVAPAPAGQGGGWRGGPAQNPHKGGQHRGGWRR